MAESQETHADTAREAVTLTDGGDRMRHEVYRPARSKPADPMTPIGVALGADIDDAIARAAAVATATDEDIRAMESRITMENRRERLARSGVTRPGPLRDDDQRAIVCDKLDQTRALQVVRGWLAAATRPASPDRNLLVLCGPRGTGKTFAAAWAIAQLGGRYVVLEEYLRDYARWQRDRTREDAAARELMRYEGSGLLVIDELRGELDEWLARLERPGWHRVVDRRQSRRRQLTIALTNITREAFLGALRDGTYDPRTYDRMRRDAYVIGVDGESLRGGAL